MNARLGTLILTFALGLLVAPSPSEAQQPAKVPRIGWLSPTSAPTPAAPIPAFEAFRQGLRDLGYVDGQNIFIESRWAEGRVERLPDLAAELVRLKVDVIVAAAFTGAQAAKQTTTTIPIVMGAVNDAVEAGLVASLEHPGGNITGFTIIVRQAARKQIELLKEVVPTVSRVAVLWDLSSPAALRAIEDQARAVGLQTQPLGVRGPNPELEGAFESATRDRADGLITPAGPLSFTHRRRIADLAVKHRLPVIFPTREYTDAGGVMVYGPNVADLYRRASGYVDKILKGAKPADLPVGVPERYELIINLKTAREIGLTIPAEVIKRADQVIQ